MNQLPEPTEGCSAIAPYPCEEQSSVRIVVYTVRTALGLTALVETSLITEIRVWDAQGLAFWAF